MEPLPDFPAFPEEPSPARGPLLWTGAALLVAAALIGALYLWHQADTEQKTARFNDLLTATPNPADRLAVTKSHLSLPAAAPELLELGGLFLKNGDLDTAQIAFTLFADHFPDHPLIAAAWLGQAEILAIQGKGEEAAPLLQKIAGSRDPQTEGYRAAAVLCLAQIRQNGGDVAGARQLLEELIAKFPSSAFRTQAQERLDSLAGR